MVAAAAAAVLVVTGMTPALADAASDEQRFVELINSERRSAGAGPLEVHPGLVGGARRHAER